MSRKFFTITAAAVGLVLGAGIGVAAAQDSGPERVFPTAESMDEMHEAMRGQMPAEFVEQCDQMHAAMGEHMGSVDMGSVGQGWMDGTGGMGGFGSPSQHAEHHPGFGR